MKILHAIAELPHPSDQSVVLVPTMGAFHRGHIDLMRAGRRAFDLIVVSLFVNPTQFGKNEDFSRYPRNLEADARMAEEAGVDILFVPGVQEVYPRGQMTTVHVPEITDRWEGAIRPGHFDGVATVVAKLFGMVRPNAAIFGQKDLQQTVVVRRMVEDLNLSVSIQIEPTTREEDGLAMSSRNAYLSADHRAIAPIIYTELRRCAGQFSNGQLTASKSQVTLQNSRRVLEDAGLGVDYFALVDRETLLPIMTDEDAAKPLGNFAIIAAARLGSTRLIDNVLV